MKRIIRKTMTYAAVLMLSACQTVARETVEKETRMKIKRTDCALTIGREFPGARGTLTTDDDGNPVLTYDFSRGGRYVGVEIRLPAPGLKSFAVSFEAERNCRASLVILEPGNRLNTMPPAPVKSLSIPEPGSSSPGRQSPAEERRYSSGSRNPPTLRLAGA